MELRPGLRIESTTSDAQFVVVKAPAGADVDLRCGGEPMAEIDGGAPRVDPSAEGESLLGKRYEHEGLAIELLCTKAGAGALAIADEAFTMKGAKPLPSSD